MENKTRDFNKAAATWDEEPRRLKLAGEVADAIAKSIPLTPSMDVLDFGCGTGLLTLNLQPGVRSLEPAVAGEDVRLHELQGVPQVGRRRRNAGAERARQR